MENSLYTALSRQLALSEKMDIISNNVANMSTPGYRAENMVFLEYVNDPSRSQGRTDPDDTLSMVLDYGHYQDSRPGPTKLTGNPLDVAIDGPAWMGVQTPDGAVQYTRAGNFTLDRLGQIVTSFGYPVAGESGGPITLPPNSGAVQIAEDGTISTDEGVVGRIMMVEFENTQTLKAVGNGLYTTDSPTLPAENSRMKQGMLEGSNVNPVMEMTRMIDVLRAYQSTQRMIQNEHERQRTMIQRMTQRT